MRVAPWGCCRPGKSQPTEKKIKHVMTHNTRRIQHLIAVHPYAIQPKLLTFGELTLDSSERGFSHLVCKLWNDFDVQAENMDTPEHFIKFLDSVQWRYSKVLISRVFDDAGPGGL